MRGSRLGPRRVLRHTAVLATATVLSSLVVLGPARAITASAASYDSTIRGDSPISYWRLDETSGTVAADQTGNSVGTIDAGATHTAGSPLGTSGESLKFDGSTSGKVTAAGNTALQPSGSWSTEVWFMASPTQGGGYLYRFHAWGLALWVGTDGLVGGAVYDTNGVEHDAVSPAGISYLDSTWHHEVVNFNRSALDLELFIDGALVTTTSVPDLATRYCCENSVGIGNDGARPVSGGYAGSMAEVAFYSSVLTPTQVRSHYTASGRTAPVAPSYPAGSYPARIIGDNPISYWRLNQTTGGASADQMSNAPGVISSGSTVGYDAAGPLGATTGNGAALAFNGVNGVVTAAANVALRPTTVWSVEAWFKTGTGGGVIYRNHAYGTALFVGTDGVVGGGFFDTGGVEHDVYSTAGTSYLDQTWHHAVVTRGSNDLQVYVDGVSVGTLTLPTNPSTYYCCENVVGIGNDPVARNAGYKGSIAEVAVYGQALSATQVQNHYGTTPRHCKIIGTGRPATADPNDFYSGFAGVVNASPSGPPTDVQGDISSYSPWVADGAGSDSGVMAWVMLSGSGLTQPYYAQVGYYENQPDPAHPEVPARTSFVEWNQPTIGHLRLRNPGNSTAPAIGSTHHYDVALSSLQFKFSIDSVAVQTSTSYFIPAQPQVFAETHSQPDQLMGGVSTPEKFTNLTMTVPLGTQPMGGSPVINVFNKNTGLYVTNNAYVNANYKVDQRDSSNVFIHDDGCY